MRTQSPACLSVTEFVQHSVEAAGGDREGTPVSVMEAGASGLPVVATRHGGIPDVVVDGETGFLVNEHDTDAMAAAMCRLVSEPALAARLGCAARDRVRNNFSIEQSMSRLWTVLANAAGTAHAVSDRSGAIPSGVQT